MQTQASSRKRAMSMKASIGTSATCTVQNTIKQRRTCKQKEYDDWWHNGRNTDKQRERMYESSHFLISGIPNKAWALCKNPQRDS
jgi:hypothetical protein